MISAINVHIKILFNMLEYFTVFINLSCHDMLILQKYMCSKIFSGFIESHACTPLQPLLPLVTNTGSIIMLFPSLHIHL